MATKNRKRFLSPQEETQTNKKHQSSTQIPFYIDLEIPNTNEPFIPEFDIHKANPHLHIINSNKLPKNKFIINIEEKDIEKALNKENWESCTVKNIKPTDAYINKNAYCINKLPHNTNKSTIKEKIENLLNIKIIYYETDIKTKLFIFIPSNPNTTNIEEISISFENNLLTIRKYDPIENYITHCKSCFSYEHFNCKKKVCPKCGLTTCDKKCNITKCINCKGNHSARYKGCPKYKKAIENAYKTRKEHYDKKRITNIEKKFDNLNSIVNNISYADITKSNSTTLNSISTNEQSISTLQTELITLQDKTTKLLTENENLQKEIAILKSTPPSIPSENTDQRLLELENVVTEILTNQNKLPIEEIICIIHFTLQYVNSNTDKNTTSNMKSAIEIVRATTLRNPDTTKLGILFTQGKEKLDNK